MFSNNDHALYINKAMYTTMFVNA